MLTQVAGYDHLGYGIMIISHPESIHVDLSKSKIPTLALSHTCTQCPFGLPGTLWQELSVALQAGALVVCNSKALQTEGTEGPSGLLRNRFYSVMETRKV